MVVACLLKEIQVSSELRKMADIELVPQETIDNLITQKFEGRLPAKLLEEQDPLISGEFEVIKELMQKVQKIYITLEN